MNDSFLGVATLANKFAAVAVVGELLLLLLLPVSSVGDATYSRGKREGVDTG
jgi:hypothetical protein